MELEKRMQEALSEFIAGDVIEKKIEKALDEAFDSLTGRFGTLTKIFQNQIEGALVPLIERHDYSQYVLKLDAVLTEVISQSARPSNDILKKFKKLTVVPKDVVSLWDVFEEYMSCVAGNVDTSDLEIGDDEGEGPGYEAVDVSVNFELKTDHFSFRNTEYATLEFRTEQDEDMNLDIELYKGTEGNWRILYGIKETNIGSLSSLSDFECYLLSLDTNFVAVEIDVEGFNESVEVVERPYD